MVQWRMLKQKAIELLGGSIAATADAIGITYQAVNQWPDELPDRIADRVYAALARKNGAAGLVESPKAASQAAGQGV